MRPVGAVIIGGYVNGLGLVRAMAARRLPVAVVTTRPYDIAHHSRHVAYHEPLHDMDARPDGLLELLERRARDWRGWALYPTNDGSLLILAKHLDRLSRHYRVVAPPEEVVRPMVDKELMVEAARSVGIDVPRCYGPATPETAARADVRFPVIVKPVVGHAFYLRFGHKLFVAHDRAALERAVKRVTEAGTPCRLFDCVPGGDDRLYVYCTYLDGRGEPLGGRTVRKHRQGPPFFGVTRVAEVVDDKPHLRDAAIALLRRVGFRGMAGCEFKYDARDGTWRFMEVNGRSVVFNHLLRIAGLDFGGLAWDDFVRGTARPVPPSGWRGVWVNLHADVFFSALYRRHDPLRIDEFLAPYRKPVVEASWCPTDPRPFLAQWGRTLAEGASALRRGTHRQLLAARTSPPGGAC
jgi:predicted ATP-grasp superfamily ATP-dependent carboligase